MLAVTRNSPWGMASLGWVTPWAATEGVTPLFFSWKTGNLFGHYHLCQFCGVTPVYFLRKNWGPFFSLLSLFIDFTQVSPPGWCHPHLFYLYDLVSPLCFVNLPTKFFFHLAVTPLEGVTRAVRSLRPPSDTTALGLMLL